MNPLKRSKKVNKNNNSFKLLSGIIFSDELNLISLKQFEFNFESQFNRSGYTVCSELTNRCHDISYLPKTKTFIISDNSFSSLVEQSQSFISDVAVALKIDKNQSIKEIANFFEDKTFLVQQRGLQGNIYKIGTFAQTAGPATMLSRTIIMSKAAGVSGLSLIKAQPLMLIVVPTVGAMFFHGCGALSGNTTVGRTCNTIGNVLNLPMFYCESVYNSYISPLVNRTIGIPTVFNYTKQAMRGPGLDTTEAIKMLSDSQKDSIVKSIKCWVIKKLGGKC